MIKIQVVEIASGEVVHEVEVKDAKSLEDLRVERVEFGLLRNLNLDQYFTRLVEAS